MQNWAAEFSIGSETLEVDLCYGRPATGTTEENIDRVRYMVMNEWRLTLNQIANAISISPEKVENTIYDERGMTKGCIKWVPCLLILDQKRARLITSQEMKHSLRQIQLVF